jgi:hypothetical protein
LCQEQKHSPFWAKGASELRTYWVSYDLDKPGQDYTDLLNAIRTIGGVRILFSDWLIKGSFTAVQLRDHLTQFLDGNDRIFVAELTGVAAWRSVMVPQETIQNILAA